MTGGDPAPRRWGRPPHGIVLLVPPLARGTSLEGVVHRVRPGLLGDAVDAAHRAQRTHRTARAVLARAPGPVRAGGDPALGRQLPCAALFVPHRPVPVPHAGPGPAPRCLYRLIETVLSSSTAEETLPARADSTVQAKVSRDGA